MNFAKLGMEKPDFGKFSKNAIDGKKRKKKKKVQNNATAHSPDPYSNSEIPTLILKYPLLG